MAILVGDDPGIIFLNAWKAVCQLSSAERLAAVKPSTAILEAIHQALLADDAATVSRGLSRISGSFATKDINQQRGCILSVMEEIDYTFLGIHPRSVVASPSFAARSPIPRWLFESRRQRAVGVAYAETATDFLVAKGPLVRASRQSHASGAETLEDRFSSLAVVPKKLRHAGRELPVNLKPISISAVDGVAIGTRTGSERVAFLPVAENPSDMNIACVDRGGLRFLNYSASPSCNVADKVLTALRTTTEIDIAIAPELVLDEAAVREIADVFSTEGGPWPRMFVAGSGSTNDSQNGQTWNEARVLNALGNQLWQQRKLWPASVDRQRCIDLGFGDPGEGSFLTEDNAAGDEIVVVDADGLGRCAILICQDIKCSPLAAELVAQFQPDWIFAPILDIGVDIGRWAHSAAYHLSDLGQTRYLLSTSTALSGKLRRLPGPYGLALGPKQSAASADLNRACAVVKLGTIAPSVGVLQWRAGDWEQAILGITSSTTL